MTELTDAHLLMLAVGVGVYIIIGVLCWTALFARHAAGREEGLDDIVALIAWPLYPFLRRRRL